MGTTSASNDALSAKEVEGEDAESDHEDKSDEQEMVGATHLLRPAKQQQERGERGQQKGGIACGVERLGEQRFAPSPLAIKEHVLAQPHALLFPALERLGGEGKFHACRLSIRLFASYARLEQRGSFGNTS
jgi:hypothetical protein